MVPPSYVLVPTALVPAAAEVVIPLINYGAQSVTVGEARPIALLDEAAQLSTEMPPAPSSRAALAIQYDRTPDWVQAHMGETNDLSQIHQNLGHQKEVENSQ